jgi:hypothetical protein
VERGALSGEGGTQSNSPGLEEGRKEGRKEEGTQVGRKEGRKEGKKEHRICGGSEGTHFVSGCPNKEIGWPILYKGRQGDRTA